MSDKHSEMTFLSTLGASVIDYFILSSHMFRQMIDLHVVPCDISHHLPVLLEFSISVDKAIVNNAIVKPRKKFVWKPHLRDSLLPKTQHV
jgi:hypothetical protein